MEGSMSVVESVTVTGGSGSFGGGIYCDNSSPTITNCRITHNSAYYDGGGIYLRDSSPTIRDCEISYNRANNYTIYGNFGGGIYCEDGSPLIENCLIMRNRTCLDPETACSGGGIYIVGPNPSAVVRGCTIVGNQTQDGGGVFCFYGSVTLENTIVWGNQAYRSGDQIHHGGGLATVTFYCSCVDTSGVEGSGVVEYLGGMVYIDPLFCNPDIDDYTLAADSPCLPGNQPAGWDCGLIGALGQGCGPSAFQASTWARIKATYRQKSGTR
jgi:parallel beta-helix repeat protein